MRKKVKAQNPKRGKTRALESLQKKVVHHQKADEGKCMCMFICV